MFSTNGRLPGIYVSKRIDLFTIEINLEGGGDIRREKDIHTPEVRGYLEGGTYPVYREIPEAQGHRRSGNQAAPAAVIVLLIRKFRIIAA